MADAATFLDSGAAKKLPAKRKAQIIADVEAQSAALSGLPPGDTAGLIDIIKRNSEIRRTTGLFNKATSRTLDSAMKYYAANFAGAEGVLRDVAAAQIRNIATDYGKLSVLEAIKSYRIQSMLSKLNTMGRNLTGNATFDILETASNNMVVPLDALVSLRTGTRSVPVDKSWFSQAKSNISVRRLEQIISGDSE